MSTVEGSINPLRKGFIIVLLATATLFFLGIIRNFLTALIIAAVFAGLLYPAHARLKTILGGRSALAAATTLILAVLSLGVPLGGLITLVVAEAVQFGEQMQAPITEALGRDLQLSDQVPDWVPFAEKIEPFRKDIQDKFTEAATSVGSWLVENLASATRGTLGALVALFVTLYAMFFFLLNGPGLISAAKSLLPLSEEDRDLVMNRGLSVTSASLKGIVVIGAVQGVLVGLGLWVCGIGSPAFWGAIVFVLSAVPAAGAPIVWGPAAAYLLLTGSVAWGIGLIVWGIVVVGLADNILRPMIVGRDAKLPDLVILLSILGGIATFGAVGIIIGPIVAAILDTTLNIYKRAFTDSLPS